MASFVTTGLNGTTDVLLMLDYEPQYRPSWNFTTNFSQRSQGAWSALLDAVHTPVIDTNWTDLVGWAVPPGGSGKGWASLSPEQRLSLQAKSWDYFVRAYLTAGVRAIKAVLPKAVDLSVWNWPFKFGAFKPAWWDGLMDEMGWLWAEMPVFMPDLYNEFYSGQESTKPAALATCTAQNTSVTKGYFQDNVDTNRRLRAAYQPGAKIFLSVWWHYMCAQHVNGDIGYFMQDGNIDALFGATGVDGIALWGSVHSGGSVPTGEDGNVTEIVEYLDRVWSPYVAKRCTGA